MENQRREEQEGRGEEGRRQKVGGTEKEGERRQQRIWRGRHSRGLLPVDVLLAHPLAFFHVLLVFSHPPASPLTLPLPPPLRAFLFPPPSPLTPPPLSSSSYLVDIDSNPCSLQLPLLLCSLLPNQSSRKLHVRAPT
eukprot:768071-Hanusia_phi.AAC.2